VRADARANRYRILAVAEELFAERGWAASTEEVARRAGVGPGTVFRHFPTKQALLEAATIRHFEQATAAVASLAGVGPSGGFEAAFRLLVTESPSKMALIGLLAEGSEPGAAVIAASQNLRATTGACLERAQTAGAIRAEVAIDEVYVLIRALAAASAMDGVSPRALAAAVDIALHGLRPA
jgi:AcrR family transcriptional regulator